MNARIRNFLLIMVCCLNPAEGQENRCSGGPGTLFQWSYATSRPLGPDLSEPLVTDRPDFTEASSTVGFGVVQFEAGYVYVNDRGEGKSFDGHAYPRSLSSPRHHHELA